MLGDAALAEPILVVSSEFHVRRAMLCFRRQGFQKVSGLNAAGISAEANPGILAALRYGLWSNLTMHITICRELLAIFSYKLCGWV